MATVELAYETLLVIIDSEFKVNAMINFRIIRHVVWRASVSFFYHGTLSPFLN